MPSPKNTLLSFPTNISDMLSRYRLVQIRHKLHIFSISLSFFAIVIDSEPMFESFHAGMRWMYGEI